MKIVSCFSHECKILDEFKKDQYIKLFIGSKMPSDDFIKQMDFVDKNNANINYLNPYLNEATAIYWMINNFMLLENPDFVGLCHYRRYLDLSSIDPSQDTIYCNVIKNPVSVGNAFSLYHNKTDLDIFFNIFKSQFDYTTSLRFGFYLNNLITVRSNIFLMPNNLFFEYSDFIVKNIFMMKDYMMNNLNLETRDQYQKRAMGFIIERLTGFWILDKNNNGVSIVNTPLIEVDITSPYQRI